MSTYIKKTYNCSKLLSLKKDRIKMLISDRKFLFCSENTKGSLELIEDAEVIIPLMSKTSIKSRNNMQRPFLTASPVGLQFSPLTLRLTRKPRHR